MAKSHPISSGMYFVTGQFTVYLLAGLSRVSARLGSDGNLAHRRHLSGIAGPGPGYRLLLGRVFVHGV